MRLSASKLNRIQLIINTNPIIKLEFLRLEKQSEHSKTDILNKKLIEPVTDNK